MPGMAGDSSSKGFWSRDSSERNRARFASPPKVRPPRIETRGGARDEKTNVGQEVQQRLQALVEPPTGDKDQSVQPPQSVQAARCEQRGRVREQVQR